MFYHLSYLTSNDLKSVIFTVILFGFIVLSEGMSKSKQYYYWLKNINIFLLTLKAMVIVITN